MRKWTGLALVIILLSFSTAFSAGTKFEKPKSGTLILGRTTFNEIKQLLGEPLRQSQTIANDKKLKWISYSYVSSADRTAFFYFIDEIMVGYAFSSSFENETTWIDPAKVYKIKQGETTRAEVMDLFGDNYGECLFPQFNMFLTNNLGKKFQNEEGVGINYMHYHSGENIYVQELIISFNKEDVVSNYNFARVDKE